jgi:Cu(I)/Ag(I) efflux system membrane protein CusA/SilA
MVPMAIPSFGGMVLQVVTVFLAPVLYSAVRERSVRRPRREGRGAIPEDG